MVQLMYKPVSLLASVFDEAPNATAIRRGCRGVLIVATGKAHLTMACPRGSRNGVGRRIRRLPHQPTQ